MIIIEEKHGRKHFYGCCLQAFSKQEIIKCHIKDCFKINGKQRIIMSKKDECNRFKKHESILVPEDNGKQNSEESYRNKYQRHIGCRYGYKLVCVDDSFSKPFSIFFSSMIKEIMKLKYEQE